MAMLPNDWHPGPRCACAECLRRWPDPEWPKPTRRRPARDILPSAPRPLIERPVLERNPRATTCEHGIAWYYWCERCERAEITRAVDRQLRG